jgi:amino acid transporter
LTLDGEPPAASGAGRLWRATKRVLIGAPIATARLGHERLSKRKALPVFASDALSSVAFATEAALLALLAGGAAALVYVLPISVVITVILALVTISYRQTLFAYPNGGGSYIVSKDNLGTTPGLVAGAALLIDYVLVVAVGVSAGVSAVASAFPVLHPYQVPLCLLYLAVITLLNLRGVGESATIFAVPVYAFVGAMLLLVAAGLVRLALGGLEPVPPPAGAAEALQNPTVPISLFLILGALAQGCSALTGVEAVSNGVQAFEPPESRNAAATLVWMSVLLAVMFVGMTYLATVLRVVPDPQHEETVLSMIGDAVFGRGLLYQLLQWSTFLILGLSANTAYAGFPMLTSIMARDRFLPSQFTFRGDRLAFTAGIVILALLAGGLVVVYGGNEQGLIPLFALGVFLAFTLSQAGMVVHHWRLREPHWRRGLALNAAGAVATLLVLVVIVVSKFTHGAWMVVVLIPVLVLLFQAIERHYRDVADELVVAPEERATKPTLDPGRIEHTVLIPVGEANEPALAAAAYARSLAGEARIVAVHVTDDVAAGERLKARWDGLAPGVPLVLIESPYRALVGPLLAYVDRFRRDCPPDRVAIVTVLLPEYLPAHWWEHVLHTQTALRLKGALLFRPRTAVTSVPYHLEARQ